MRNITTYIPNITLHYEIKSYKIRHIKRDKHQTR